MRCVVDEGVVKIKDISVTPIKGGLLLTVTTNQKYPIVSRCLGSVYGPEDYVAKTIDLRSWSNKGRSTQIELIATTKAEKLLFNNCYDALLYVRYGPDFIIVTRPTDAQCDKSFSIYQNTTMYDKSLD